ncbi:MAG: recombinase family protein [Dorea sp.]|nr:recombinase family protein [Dorea sp.]
MKRAALYVRGSTQEQKIHGMSVDSQIDALKVYCEKNGYEIAGIYNDAGISARKRYTKRPALLSLLNDCEKGLIDIVLFTKLDRWFRSVADYYDVKKVLDKTGVTWRTIWEEYDPSTHDGVLKINLMLSVAQDEADRTSSRIRAVNKYRKSQGYYVGTAPRGYKTNKGQLLIDPDMQPYIQKFFDTYMLTFSPAKAIESVADHITISRITAIKMLRNRTYCGDADGYQCEPYITEEQYRKIQDSIEGRRIRDSVSKRVYYFSGLIRCPECGHNMTGRMYRRGQYEYKIYHCASNTNKGACRFGGNVYEKKLEEYLLDQLDEIIRDVNIKISQKDKENPEAEIKALQLRLDRIGTRFELGDYTVEEYKQKRDEIKHRIALLQSQKPVMVKPLPEGWQSIYNDLNEENKRAFWNNVIKKIDVTGTGRGKGFRINF